MKAADEFKANWPLLLGCMLGVAIGVHSLPFYTAGLFMVPLADEFGWSRAQVSLAPTLLMISLGVAAPFAGAAIDRFGERRTAMVSLSFVAAGFFALSFQTGALPLYFGLFILMAVTGAGASTITFSRLLVRNFIASRGTALGIAMIGTGVASSLATMLLVPLIDERGWRAGYLALAIVIAIGAPLIWLLTRGSSRPQQMETMPGHGVTVGTALAGMTFWKLVAAFFLVALASAGLLIHFLPLLIDAEIPLTRATSIAGMIGIFLIVGRLSAGVLFDLAFAPRIAAALMAASAGGLAALALGGAEYALLGALAIGLSFGAEMDLVGYLCVRYFGTLHYGRIYGLLYTVVLAGTSLSPLIYGALRDHHGSYTGALGMSSILLVASALVFLTMPRFRDIDPIGDRSAPSDSMD